MRRCCCCCKRRGTLLNGEWTEHGNDGMELGFRGIDRRRIAEEKDPESIVQNVFSDCPSEWGDAPTGGFSADGDSFLTTRGSSKSLVPAQKKERSKDECYVCKGSLYDAGGIVQLEIDGGEVKIHESCFICHHDRKPIEGDFMTEAGSFYCMEHHIELFCETCGGCTKKISEGAKVRALGDFWHVECFKCAKCENPLANQEGSFDFNHFSGDVFCKPCHEEHNCDKCAECGFPITKNGLQADGHKWHVECFTCHECGTTLSGKKYGKIDGFGDANFCEKHLKQLKNLSPADLENLTKATTMCHSKSQRRSVDDHAPTGDDYGACLSHGISCAIAMQKAKIKCQASAAQINASAFKASDQTELNVDDIAFDFEAFAPAVFQDLRNNAFKYSEEDYKSSISLRPLTGGVVGEGKSGSLFFFSWDKKLIVKTVETVEVPFFRKCLRDYHGHLIGKDAPRQQDGCTASLLCRFLGFYSIKMPNVKVLRVVVIDNVFPAYTKMNETYDLKGVLGKKRFVTEEEQKAGVKVLKDRNILNRPRLCIDGLVCEKLILHLQRDARFLRERDRIDYSLLLGIIPIDKADKDKHPKKPDLQWPVPESHGVRSSDPDGEEVLYMGIIDILQPYTAKKRMESILKRSQHMVKEAMTKDRAESDVHVAVDVAVSAAHPIDYAARFVNFLEGLLEGRARARTGSCGDALRSASMDTFQ